MLGVDSSTQATKVEVRDADTGKLVASGRNPHPPTTPPRSEQDPTAWWEALEPLLRDDVDAVSVAAQQHGLVALDDRRALIRPAKLWNDTESAADAGWLLKQLGGAVPWAAACGSVPVAAFTITKLSWLHRTEPDAFARLAHVLLPHDWLTFRLAGELVTDRGDASGTGYWSPAEDRWRFDLLGIVDGDRDWEPMLPRVLGPTAAAGEWRGAVVGPGTGDNMAAALGIGMQPGDVAVSIGTSGTVFAVSDRPTNDATGAVAGFADATGRYLPLVCTLNATKVTDAVARLLSVELEELDRLALEAPAGAGGLVLVPYLDGERTPDRPGASGTLAGLRSDVTREQLARAAFEGVVCGLLDGLDALSAAGVSTADGRLLLAGGGARSAAYRQVLADLAGRAVTVAEGDEPVARGACVQAAAVLHDRAPHEVVAAWGEGAGATTVEPGSDSAAAPDIRTAYAEARNAAS